jgi:hypothetical protein
VRRRLGFALAIVSICLACTPPQVQRPLEGAPPITNIADASKNGAPALGIPPTLSAATSAAGASPSPDAAAGPRPSPSPSPEAGYVIVATDGRGANLRETPGLSTRVLTTLAEGTAVEVFGDTATVDGREWRKIRGAGREGWVVAPVVRRR